MKEEELELILKIFDESGDGTLSVAEILAWFYNFLSNSIRFESDPRFKSANFDMEKLTELSLQFQK
jgi:Ca2+-binding EF-hand superfamily protein